MLNSHLQFFYFFLGIYFQRQLNCSTSQERASNIAYNIVNGLCTPVKDLSAPVYITFGDGGNIEGLAKK